jgi:DNA-binding CsgD family transcriptional regulator
MHSFVEGSRGDHESAERMATEALTIFRETGDDLWLPFALNRLGIERQERGDWNGAETLFQEALDRWRPQGLEWGISTGLANLAQCARARGEDERAAALFRESLPYAQRWGVIEALTGLAGIAAAHGQAEIATHLFAAADAMRVSIGLTLQRYVQIEIDRAIAAVRTELGEARFAAAWEAGHAYSLAQAVADTERVGATGQPGAPLAAAAKPAATAPVNTAGLTGRELEVLRLLAEGRSSREIGDELFISHRTATTHVTNIFTKLDVDNRAAAVARAFQLGIL